MKKTFNEQFDEKFNNFGGVTRKGFTIDISDEIKQFFLSEIKKIDAAVEGNERVHSVIDSNGNIADNPATCNACGYNEALSDIRALLKEYLTK